MVFISKNPLFLAKKISKIHDNKLEITKTDFNCETIYDIFDIDRKQRIFHKFKRSMRIITTLNKTENSKIIELLSQSNEPTHRSNHDNEQSIKSKVKINNPTEIIESNKIIMENDNSHLIKRKNYQRATPKPIFDHNQ